MRRTLLLASLAVVASLAWLLWRGGSGTERRLLEPGAPESTDSSSAGELRPGDLRTASDASSARSAALERLGRSSAGNGSAPTSLAAPDALRFRVVDRADGLPVAGAVLTPRGMREDESPLVADAAGDASCDRDRLDRRAVLEVTAESYALALVGIDQRKLDADAVVVVELSRAAALSGRVLGLPRGAAHELILATSDVFLLQGIRDEKAGGESRQWREPIDEAGHFAFDGLPPQIPLYASWVAGRKAGGRLQVEPLQLEPGERRIVEWDLAPSCSVVGRVVDGTGNALADVAVELRLGSRPEFFHEAPDNLSARADTDEEGEYRIAGLKAAEYVVGLPVVYDNEPIPQFASEGHAVSLSGGELRVPDLVAYPAAYVRGRVIGVDGKASRSAFVVARLDDVSAYDESDGQGNFSIGPLVPREYEVAAHPAGSTEIASEPVLVIAPVDDLELRLLEGAVVTGSIVDPLTKSTLDGFAAIHQSGTKAAVLDEGRGGPRFRFGALGPGHYDLIVESTDGRVGIRRGVEVGEGERVDHVEVPVGPAGELRVTLGGRTNVFPRVHVGEVTVPEFSKLGPGAHRFRVPVGSALVELVERDGSISPLRWRTLESRLVQVADGETTVVAFD
ncbi:MAG: carboxypeptidase regulatory-like domain-containing protein [Planctomycetes bacterium]|nr:carboxypeptidase regulatory-like domain-containing protein [Planctomycetota bacterium]MCB9903345.1 carboxypeptidase regulatory-like domain-containing protein [Planctomycetota bacterium]